MKATKATVAKAAAISSKITATANNHSDFPDHASKEKRRLVDAIRIPETNMALITPDLIANNPKSLFDLRIGLNRKKRSIILNEIVIVK